MEDPMTKNAIEVEGDLKHHPVVLFDGVCNLCNAAVAFIIDRDSQGVFRFAPLQSDIGQILRARCDLDSATIDSIVVVEQGQCLMRSSAALAIAKRLDGLWPLLYGFILIPLPVRDTVYDFVATHRYRWFGKKDTCRLPLPDERARFLSYEVRTPTY